PPSSGTQTSPEGQLSSQVPVGHEHSGSATEATSSRPAPAGSVRQPDQVVLVERSTPSRCKRRAWFENQYRCLPSAARKGTDTDSVMAKFDPVVDVVLATSRPLNVVAACPSQNHTSRSAARSPS